MRLYSYFRSSSAYRVRLAMNLKALPYSIEPVHLLKNGGQQFSEAHGQRNPFHQVPVLEVNGQFLYQSMAICLYLEDEFPQKPLLSSDPWKRAEQIAFCEVINSGIQPLQNLSVLNKLDSKLQLGPEGKKQWVQEVIIPAFDGIEKVLSRTAGKYSFGNDPSLADCFLIPQVFAAKRNAVDMNRYPNICAVDKNISELAAAKAAHPEQQPDFEP